MYVYATPYTHLQHSKMYMFYNNTPSRTGGPFERIHYAVCCTDEPFFILVYIYNYIYILYIYIFRWFNRSFVRCFTSLMHSQRIRYSSAAVYFHIATESVACKRCEGSSMYRSFSSAHSFSFLMFGCIVCISFFDFSTHKRKREKNAFGTEMHVATATHQQQTFCKKRREEYAAVKFEPFFIFCFSK